VLRDHGKLTKRSTWVVSIIIITIFGLLKTITKQTEERKKEKHWTRVSNSSQGARPEFQTRARELDPSLKLESGQSSKKKQSYYFHLFIFLFTKKICEKMGSIVRLDFDFVKTRYKFY
jgi:hypothetical protein